jgi:hypothetical protein
MILKMDLSRAQAELDASYQEAQRKLRSTLVDVPSLRTPPRAKASTVLLLKILSGI